MELSTKCVREVSWSSPVSFPVLENGDVHVWKAPLLKSKAELDELLSYLSVSEQDRANKFLVAHAKNEFIVARGLLRKLLAGYLCITPKEIEFRQNQYGKPGLVDSALPIQFNISHSKGLAVFVFTLNDAVGIDVEHVNWRVDVEAIAKKFFLDVEVAALMAMPEDVRLPAFFHFWTCKEAVTKASGVGICTALSQLEIVGDCFVSPKIGVYHADDGVVDKWVLHSLLIESDYVVTLAVRNMNSNVQYRLIVM